MFSFQSSSDRVLDALDLSMAIIEFDLEGRIIKANKNFCDLMGYQPRQTSQPFCRSQLRKV